MYIGWSKKKAQLLLSHQLIRELHVGQYEASHNTISPYSYLAYQFSIFNRTKNAKDKCSKKEKKE